MTRTQFPFLSDFKDNKTFHGLALARAIVSVLHVVASILIFQWQIVTTIWEIKNGNCCCVTELQAGLSISFEVASSFWKVGVSLRREPPRGVWGHAPSENFEI